MKRNLTLLLLVSLITITHAQKKIKFGVIPDEQLNMETCPIDEEAGAVVLSDVGHLWFNISTTGSFDIMIERHVRIKIFNSTEYDQANIEIPYYTGRTNDARISNVKAHTIIPRGKDTEEVKVAKSDMFDEKLNDFYSAKKFTFPKIDDGVIIEYKYQLTTSDYSIMKVWEFQQEIPVLLARYDARIPEYFDCTVSVVGHNSAAVKYKASSQNEEDFLSNIHEFEGRNLPAMKSERYGTNIRNFTTKARTIIRSFRIPGRFVETIAGNYTEFNKTLMEQNEFLQLDQKTNYLEDQMANIERSNNKLLDLYNIVDYVKKKTVWNDYHSFYPNLLMRETLNGKDANSASVNMLLTCLLKKAGYQAEALILGSRDYRRPHPSDPDFNDFDHLVSYVTLENGKEYILDGTSVVKGGLPETNIFNAEGWIVSSENARKIWLSGFGEAKMIVSSKCDLNPGNEVLSQVDMKSNYLGLHLLSDGESYDGNGFKKWMDDKNEQPLENFSQDNSNDLASLSFDLKSDELSDKDIFYFAPDYFGLMDFDIFSREERLTPLDIPYRINVTNMIELSIPDGYILESGPISKKYGMTENDMKFTYVVTATTEKVNINLRFKVDRIFYLPEAYQDVRAFMNELQSTLNEKFVFKKAE